MVRTPHDTQRRKAQLQRGRGRKWVTQRLVSGGQVRGWGGAGEVGEGQEGRKEGEDGKNWGRERGETTPLNYLKYALCFPSAKRFLPRYMK